MPTDLEQQLPRFAEALDREAPAISVDEILSRRTVAVDVDRLQRPAWDQVPCIAAVPWGDARSGHRENGEGDASIELAPTAAEPPTRRRAALKIALAGAAAAVLVVTLAAIVRSSEESDPADVPTVPTPSIVPTPPTPTTEPPSTVRARPPTATEPPTSGGMWPQSTLDEVSAAQELADAGDPGYTWQVGAELSLDDRWAHVDELEIVDRFLREVLGWEAYLFNSRESGDETGNGEGDGWAGGVAGDLEFLRCAPGLTNPLYPPHPDGRPGTSCAPTLDELHYESVRLDLAQLDREGLDGIWVVNRWMLTAPFAQTDPAALSAQVTQRLEEWLAARLAGEGAEGQVASNGDLPLLYATTSGALYERYEIERLDVGGWPDGDGATFRVRLFADGGTTVVEQKIGWNPGFGLPMSVDTTTENGQSVARSVSSDDGEVTATVLDPWNAGSSHPEVWAWGLSRLYDNEVRVFIDVADPVAYDSWCAALGGSPVLSAPADAAAIAQTVSANANFETTARVGVRVGGVDAISIDVALAPGGRAPCGDGFEGSSLPWQVGGRWIHELSQPGRRLRIYLVDLPEGMTVQTMAITVVATDERFVEVIEETKPIIDSIEFHPRAP